MAFRVKVKVAATRAVTRSATNPITTLPKVQRPKMRLTRFAALAAL